MRFPPNPYTIRNLIPRNRNNIGHFIPPGLLYQYICGPLSEQQAHSQIVSTATVPSNNNNHSNDTTRAKNSLVESGFAINEDARENGIISSNVFRFTKNEIHNWICGGIEDSFQE